MRWDVSLQACQIKFDLILNKNNKTAAETTKTVNEVAEKTAHTANVGIVTWEDDHILALEDL